MNTELLQKYIAGNATEAEKQRATEWIQENPENMRYPNPSIILKI